MRVKHWTAGDGRTVPLPEMTDRHLINAMRFLYRNAKEQLRDAQGIVPHFQGEMAQYYAEQEWQATFDADPWDYADPILNDMQKEADRRGLEPWADEKG